jgi:hypothetical protein
VGATAFLLHQNPEAGYSRCTSDLVMATLYFLKQNAYYKVKKQKKIIWIFLNTD